MLRGKRVELRAIERDLLKNYVAWFNDPEVMAYFGRFEPMSLAQEERWYESQIDSQDTKSYAVFFEGEHVGGAGYHRINMRNRHAEVGLLIGRKDLWDKGLGADILQVLLRQGFEQMNFHSLYLWVFADNARAIHCYEKAGFKRMGRMRDAEFRHGRYHDMLLMGILEDEYRQCDAGCG